MNNIHFIQTNQFKDVTISLRFICELEQKRACVRSLLANMLTDRTALYNTKEKMSNKCDLEYGASLYCRTYVLGNAQVFEMRIMMINEKYADHPLLEEQVGLIRECLLNPYLDEKGDFMQDIVTEAKDNTKAMIDRRKDNPTSYAVTVACKTVGEGQPLGITNFGSKELVDEVTLTDLKEEYQRMLKEDAAHVYVMGNFDEERMRNLIEKQLPFNYREIEVDPVCPTVFDSEVTVEETRVISQTACVMMATTPITMRDKECWTLRLGNAIFGGLPTSLLFQHVREKRSLCYSIYSMVLLFDGVICIVCGIDRKNKEEVIGCVKDLLQMMRNNEFTEEEFNTAKKMVISSLKTTKDVPSALIGYHYQNEVLHQDMTLQQIEELIQGITKEEVAATFEKVQLKATVLIEQEENDDEEDCE